MTTGLYEKASAAGKTGPHHTGFGGWLAFFWGFACVLVAWHLATVIGDGDSLLMMFDTPDNAAIMRAALWVKVWLWAPFLILAPLEHRLTRAVAIVSVLICTVGEGLVIGYLLHPSPDSLITINVVNVLIAVAFCGYLGRSKRAAAIGRTGRPVDARARTHFSLLVLVAGGITIAIFAGAADTIADRVSIVTAWQFMFLLAIVLLIGPVRVFRTGKKAVNIHLRRDFGVWTGIVGLLHLYAGLAESMNPAYIAMVIDTGGNGPASALRQQIFAWATIVGLVTTVFVLLLLVLSSDRSIRQLGKRWWKRLHRASYIVFTLTIVHAFAFQYLEHRSDWLVILTAVLAVTVVGAQVAGYLRIKRQAPRTPQSARR